MTGAARVVLCNGAELPEDLTAAEKPLVLEYRESEALTRNVKVSLPDFVRGVFHLSERVLDLLEIAAYVFAADRSAYRGDKDALEFHGWARSFHIVVKVRDFEFWSLQSVQKKLAEALEFMSGDDEYRFTFQAGHATPPTSLFDSKEFVAEPHESSSVVLFSGGLDSLAGIVERLETTDDQLYLVSHRSQSGTAKTQDSLFRALRDRYPGRLRHYKFHCSLKGAKAREETQRTRSFLFGAIAYALSHVACREKGFFVYENGVTSINFPKRQDMMNARASRTTHPRTIALLRELLCEVQGGPVEVRTPFLFKTKTDVLTTLAAHGRRDLISSSVSCGSTRQKIEGGTHCGGCSQCVDRRFGAYAAGLDDEDESGIYASDFLEEEVEGAAKTTLMDYVRQARDFATWNEDHFHDEMFDDLLDVLDYVQAVDEEEAFDRVLTLCRRHGRQTVSAIRRMRDLREDLIREPLRGSFLNLVNSGEYFKDPVSRLVEDICERLSEALPIAFRRVTPKDENDFNDKVESVLSGEGDRYEREYPAIRFALANAVPDHSLNGDHLLIESKYLRGSTSPSKASEGMAADLTKYQGGSHILFVVYDPSRSIGRDNAFRRTLQDKGRCTVCIVR